MTKNNNECCQKFNPLPWDERQIIWNNKLFTKDHVTSLFHIPINFGSTIKHDMDLIEKEEALSSPLVILSDEKSRWSSDLLIAVDTKVRGLNSIEISGKFLSKVFEGSYRNINKWVKEMKEYVESENYEMEKFYFYYTTCPKCAKKYDKNYVVILAKV